jgi:RNA polymerase sigma-70 factor (ECF subfamily)
MVKASDRYISELAAMTVLVTDEDLVRGTLNGDEDAFSGLYDRYRQPVFSTAYRIIQNFEEAQDATQEIFVKLYRSLGTYDAKQSKFSTWLYRLATNHAIDYWRVRRRRAESQIDTQENEHALREYALADAIRSPYRRVESGEEVDEVRRCVRVLPELQKKVFILRYFQELKLEEIAEMEQCSLGTIKTTLFRATHAVRRSLRRFRGLR